MGFSNNSYARVWKVEHNEKYSTANISISRKNKETNRYDVEFQDGYVRLVGKAHNISKSMDIQPEKGVSIKINSCDVTNYYDLEKRKLYTNYVIFDFDIADSNYNKDSDNYKKSTSKEDDNVDDMEDELPF